MTDAERIRQLEDDVAVLARAIRRGEKGPLGMDVRARLRELDEREPHSEPERERDAR
jgi:hypothetical protein